MSQQGISQGSAYSVVYDNLELHKASTSWMPKQLTGKHKLNCSNIRSHHFKQCNRECENSVNYLITGDKTWIYYYESETKWQGKQWKPTPPSTVKQLNYEPSGGKLMWHHFGTLKHPSLNISWNEVLQSPSLKYYDMLRNYPRMVVHTKWRGRLSDSSFCYTTLCMLIQQPMSWKFFNNWKSALGIWPDILTRHLYIFVSLDLSRKLWKVVALQIMTRNKTQCEAG